MIENPIARAIERLGGMTRAVVRTGYSEASWHRWRRTRRIPDAIACLKVASLTGIAAEELAGVDLAPTGTDEPRIRQDAGAANGRGAQHEADEAPASAVAQVSKVYGTIRPRKHTPWCSPTAPVFLLPIYHDKAA